MTLCILQQLQGAAASCDMCIFHHYTCHITYNPRSNLEAPLLPAANKRPLLHLHTRHCALCCPQHHTVYAALLPSTSYAAGWGRWQARKRACCSTSRAAQSACSCCHPPPPFPSPFPFHVSDPPPPPFSFSFDAMKSGEGGGEGGPNLPAKLTRKGRKRRRR